MAVLALRENSTWFNIESEERRHLIHIVMTERCNLSCSYCYQSHHGAKESDYPRVREKLQLVLEHFNGKEKVSIRFFGGEPLLAFNDIKKLTADAKRIWETNYWSDNGLVFGITTNGTLLNDEIKQWLEKNPDVSLSLSLDGTPEAHNANRSDSYDRIKPHFHFFRRYNNPVKMTIGPKSIDRCAEGIRHIHSLGFECQANLIFEDAWGDEKEHARSLLAFEQQLAELVTFYTQHPEITRTTLLPVLSRQLPIMDKNERWKSNICGMGRNMTTIGVDGKTYPCSRVIPFYQKGAGERIEISRKEFHPTACATCKLQPMCPECRAFNFETYGDTNRKTRFHCEFVQLQLRASALLTLSDVMQMNN